MRGAAQNLREVVLGVGRAVGVSRAAEFLESQTCFIGRRSSGVADVLTEDREGLPQSKCFEGQDNLHASTVGYVLDQREIATQLLFFNKIIGSLQVNSERLRMKNEGVKSEKISPL